MPAAPPTIGQRPRSAFVHIAVFVGGGAGALTRYGVGTLGGATPPDFPWQTFVVNMVGALLIGFATTALTETWSTTQYMKPLVLTGLLGGLTTWSTFIVETDQLISAGQTTMALTYLAASIGLGLVFAATGVLVARRVGQRRLTAEAI